MRKVLFDENSQEELASKGYTKVSQVLSGEEIDYLLKELISLSPGDKFAPDKNGEFGFTFHCTFLDTDVNYKRHAQKLINKVFSPCVESLLSDYKILTGNFFIKPPGTGELMVHRNWTFVEDINDTTITLWCPLIDVDETNGTIQLVEGSHNIIPHITTPTASPFFKNFENKILDKYSKPISLKAGEGLIFDDNLLHGSGNNKSTYPRYVAQIVCVPKDSKSVIYYLDQNSSENRFEIFEIDSDFFIGNMMTDILTRPNHLKSLGFVNNKNTIVSEEEFYALLGPKGIIMFERKGEIRQDERPSLLHRIKTKLKAFAR